MLRCNKHIRLLKCCGLIILILSFSQNDPSPTLTEMFALLCSTTYCLS